MQTTRTERPQKYIDYKGLCSLLGISKPTAERLVAQGAPHLKVGRLVRFDADAFVSWLEKRTA